jgi:hypothetical protein
VRYEPLIRELHELGRTVRTPAVDTEAVTRSVMARVADRAPDVQRATGARRRRRALAVAIAATLIALALTPPVRAAVTDWFGVIVRAGAPAESQPVPGVDGRLTLDGARDLVRFEPIIPASLGEPAGVDVSPDGRVLSMSWSGPNGEVIRLDQFAGDSPTFAKESAFPVEEIDLGGTTGLWFDGPHHLIRVDEHGNQQLEPARSAGPTLVMQVDGLTLRLEGMDRVAAAELARSILGTR